MRDLENGMCHVLFVFLPHKASIRSFAFASAGFMPGIQKTGFPLPAGMKSCFTKFPG